MYVHLIFDAFNFRRLSNWWKNFNGKKFPIYGMWHHFYCSQSERKSIPLVSIHVHLSTPNVVAFTHTNGQTVYTFVTKSATHRATKHCATSFQKPWQPTTDGYVQRDWCVSLPFCLLTLSLSKILPFSLSGEGRGTPGSNCEGWMMSLLHHAQMLHTQIRFGTLFQCRQVQGGGGNVHSYVTDPSETSIYFLMLRRSCLGLAGNREKLTIEAKTLGSRYQCSATKLP